MRPIGLLFAIVRVQCKLRRIEAEVWEASNRVQAAWSEWATADGHAVATLLYDLLKAFDHVAFQKLTDAAVRTRFPVETAQAAAAALPGGQACRARRCGW